MDEGIRGSMAALTASSPGVAAGQARFGTPFRLSLLGPGTLQSPESERDEGAEGRAGSRRPCLDGAPSFSYGAGQLLSHTLPAYVPEGTPRGIGDIPRGRHSGKWPGNMVRTRPWGWAATGSPEIVRRHVRPAGGCAMMETRPGSSRRSGPRQRSLGPRRRHGKEVGRAGGREGLRRRCGRAHRAILSGPRKSTARAPSPGPHVCGWCMYGRCRDGSSLHAPPPLPTREGAAHARMAMSDSRSPISVCRVVVSRRRFVGGLVARQVGSAASVECRGPSKLLGGVEGWRWHTA